MWEHGTKTTLLLWPADGEASWLLLPSSVSLLSGDTVQPENTYSSILKVTGQVWEDHNIVTRRAANQGQKVTFSPWGKTGPAGHQPSISMSRGDDGNIDGNTITNPYDIANIFNNYLTFVAEAAKQNIKFLHKYFSDYLKKYM